MDSLFLSQENKRGELLKKLKSVLWILLSDFAGGPGWVSCTVVETAMWLNLLHPLLFSQLQFFIYMQLYAFPFCPR